MTQRRALWACLLVVAFASLTLLFTYPLAFHANTHHIGEAGGDAKIYLWNYWWVRHALTELGTNPFETTQIFYPIGIGLSLHTLALFQGLAFTPASYLLGDVLAANAIVLWTFVASALATYMLARRLGAERHGAFLAGVIFAFCPYRLARLAGHYDLLGTEWIPAFILCLWILFEEERFRPAVAVATAVTAAACGYTASSYLVFLGMFTLLFFTFWVTRGKLAWRTALARGAPVTALLGLLLLPMLAQLYQDLSNWTYPPYPGADRYAADLLAYVTPGAQQAIFGSSLGRSFDSNITETTVFPGFLALGLAALAGVAWFRRSMPSPRRASIPFWLLTLGFFFVLSLGSTLRLGGHDTGLPLPFLLVSRVPLLEQLRAPSRFAVLVMISLAMLAGLIWSWWMSRLSSFGARLSATLGMTLLLVLETITVPVPLFAASMPAVYQELIRNRPEGTLLEIPGIDQAPQQIMYHQTRHRKPIFIGTAARIPREKTDYYFGLQFVRPLIDLRKGRLALTPQLLEEQRELAPSVARFLDLSYLVVDKAYEKRGVIAFIEATLPVRRVHDDATLVVFETQRDALPENPMELLAAGPISRQHFESGWSRPEPEPVSGPGFRWANQHRSTVLFRRPSDSVRDMVLELSPLEGLEIEMQASIHGKDLGSTSLTPGWQEVRWTLPQAQKAEAVERLELRWSALRRASEQDRRRIAARVRGIRFE